MTEAQKPPIIISANPHSFLQNRARRFMELTEKCIEKNEEFKSQIEKALKEISKEEAEEEPIASCKP